MKTICTFVIVFVCMFFFSSHLFAAATGSTFQQTPEFWTAENAVVFALIESPDTTIARKRIEEAQAIASLAQSADYPLVNISAEYGQTNNPMYSFGNILNQGAFDSSIDFNDPGRTDNLQLKTEILYRLYNGGRDKARREGADANIDVYESDFTGVHQLLGFQIVRTFQAIIQAEKMVLVRQEALEAITAAHEVGFARYEAGDLLQQDLLNLELQQSRAKENLIKSSHTLDLTKRSFLNLLGLREGSVVINPEGGAQLLLPEVLDFSNRHELRRLEAQLIAAQAELDQAQGGKMPTIDAFASYQIDQGWQMDENGDSWIAGLRVDYSLFDGQKTSSEITLARLKLQELEGHMNKLELALNLELEQAKLDYEQVKQRLEVTRKMITVAEEVTRLSRVRFKEGLILASDLIDFEMRLSDAQARHLAANSAYQVAIANLRRVTGLSQF